MGRLGWEEGPRDWRGMVAVVLGGFGVGVWVECVDEEAVLLPKWRFDGDGSLRRGRVSVACHVIGSAELSASLSTTTPWTVSPLHLQPYL